MTPIIQAAIEQELKDLLEDLAKSRQTHKEFKGFEAKLHQTENKYHLFLDIKFRPVSSNEIYRGNLPEPIVRFSVGSNVNIVKTVPNPIMKKTLL
jgi:hypothetical protein